MALCQLKVFHLVLEAVRRNIRASLCVHVTPPLCSRVEWRFIPFGCSERCVRTSVFLELMTCEEEGREKATTPPPSPFFPHHVTSGLLRLTSILLQPTVFRGTVSQCTGQTSRFEKLVTCAARWATACPARRERRRPTRDGWCPTGRDASGNWLIHAARSLIWCRINWGSPVACFCWDVWLRCPSPCLRFLFSLCVFFLTPLWIIIISFLQTSETHLSCHAIPSFLWISNTASQPCAAVRLVENQSARWPFVVALCSACLNYLAISCL